MLRDVDKLRLTVQGGLALGVLAGATFLAYSGTINGESVVALYAAALGAVGAGAVGGSRQTTPPPHNGEAHVGSSAGK